MRKTAKRKSVRYRKCHFSYSFFLSFFLSCYDHYSQQQYLANGLSTHHQFSTKLMLITARSSTTTRRLHSFKFTLVNKSHSQHPEAAVRCLGRHFQILYACAHEVSFPDQRPRSLVWKQEYTSEWAWLARSFPPGALGKAYEHHVGKALHSAAYL